MSNNQKQTPSVVSQPHTRYQGPYMQQRPDGGGYHVATPPTYVQQPPPNQGNNQVQSLRGMPPTGPPNQASTPPNTDLKVQMPQQQPSMNIAYVSQLPVRGPAQNLYQPRAPQPTTQSSRMAGHRQGQPQHIFQTQPQYVPIMQQSVPYINSPQYFNGGPRPQPGFVAPFQMLPGQLPAYSYQTAQTQPATFFYGQPSIQIQRPPLSSVTTVQQNPTQPSASAMPLPPPPLQLNTMTATTKKRRYAIPIIDPTTGKDKLTEMYEQQDDSHPASGESSARQTPQPSVQISSKEVQAAFARQVTEAIKDEEIEYDSMDPIEYKYSIPPQAVPHQGFESIIQTSKLQVATKEFVPAAALNNISKETTPVVSAITDAVEVTITNKPKDRESPVKSRKPREPMTVTVKEPVSVKEKEDTTICETPVSVTVEEIKAKDTITTNVAPNKESVVTADRSIPKKEASPPISTTPVPVIEETKLDDIIPEFVPACFSIPDDVSIAKTKQASIKTKEFPKQPQQVLPSPQPLSQPHVTSTTPSPPLPVVQKVLQTMPPPIPVPQPTKPNNKTSKIRDINMKGALKEGTDMDAFNDNAEENNITNTDYVNSDYVNNDNSTMLNNNEDANKNNDITTIKPIIETKLKSKFDVTAIVKDTPKPIKPITTLPPVESPDEVDRAVLANDKIVQAKNEANTKASAEIIDTNLTEAKSLPYQDDQWSPLNPDGKKRYGFDFLMALRNDPKSKLKPDNIPTDILANDARGRAGDMNRYAVSGRQTDFAPNFGNNVYANKNSQRGTIVKRKSQQGSSSSSIKAGSRPSVIRVSISVKEDVKLREVENAWRPARLVPGENSTEDEKKTAELYKKVRGVLNKLTPQKFSQLLDQVRTFNIDTSERLQGVIDLVFEKAVDEPNFSVAYALLCKELSMMQVPTGDTRRKDKEGQPPEYVNFRKLLVTRCQIEFEKNSIDESDRNEKVKEIDLCEDPERKKDMQLDLDEYDRRLRMKSVGNIRFIGELFKQNMLTANIMVRCLNNLLSNKDEESLECLCKLMSTVGKELEMRKVDLNPIFVIMREIVDKRHGKISSRVRFMIQDVIDLRQSQWVPRRQDFNPKTMDQIQKEAENEQLVIQAMNAGPITPRKDDRLTSGGGGSMHNERKPRRNVGGEEGGWQVTQPRNSRSTQINVQYDKLKTVTPLTDEPLGSSQMFYNWSAGANVKPTVGTNIYSALENIGTDSDKRIPSMGMRPHSKDQYNSKGPSLERNYRQQYDDGRGSRSGSQHRSRDSSASHHSSTQQSSIPPIPIPSTFAPPSIPAAVTPRDQPTSTPPVAEMSHDEIETQLRKILDDYLTDFDITECDNDVKRLFPPSALPKVVTEGYNSVLERSKTARWGTGQLFAKLIKLGTLSVEDYSMGLTEFLSVASDLIIDIPKLWDYMGELIAPILCEDALTMRDLYKCCDILISQSYASKLLISLFNLVIHEKSPNFLHSIWSNSDLYLSSFMPESQVDSFIKENKFECLFNADSSSSYKPTSILSQQEIYNKLVAFFKSNTSFDDIVNWITVNVGEGVAQLPFIRTLATACFEESVVQNKFKLDILKSRSNLILRYVDTKPEFELQCLFALQAFINKLEHPSGLLLLIFDKIYEENLFSHESFLAWEESTDPAEQEGKGVSLMQLTSFFTQLKEAEDEDSCGSSEETGG